VGLDVPFGNLTAAQKEAYWAGEKAVLEEYAAAGFTFIESGPPGGAGLSLDSGKTVSQIECLTRYLHLCQSVGITTFFTPTWAGGTVTEAESGDVLAGYVSARNPCNHTRGAGTPNYSFTNQNIADEPMNLKFAELANLSRQLETQRPGKLRFINLLPNYFTTDDGSYVKGYVKPFVEQVRPNMLSMDHYPHFDIRDDGFGHPQDNHTGKPTDSRAGYRANLAIFRNYSLSLRIPVWNYFYLTPMFGLGDPSEGQLAWQMFTSLAYNVRGIQLFCYNSPAGQGTFFDRGGGIRSPTGTLNGTGGEHGHGGGNNPLTQKLYKNTPHYEQMSRLNPLVSAIGNFLTGATSTGVWRVHAPKAEAPQFAEGSEMQQWQPPTDLSAGCALSGVGDAAAKMGDGEEPMMGLSVSPLVAGQGVLIGQWRLADNRTAVLINNHNWDWNLWPTIIAAAPFNLSRAMELSLPAQSHDVPPRNSDEFKAGARETPLLDDSPLLAGWQMALTAGRGRLIIFPEVVKTDDDISIVEPAPTSRAVLRPPPGERQLFIDAADVSSILNLQSTMHRPTKRGTAIAPPGLNGSLQVRTTPLWIAEEQVYRFLVTWGGAFERFVWYRSPSLEVNTATPAAVPGIRATPRPSLLLC
jgi:hypothetical protein